MLDARIETKRFAYITQRKAHYERLSNDYSQINAFLEEKIGGAKNYARDLYHIDQIYEKTLFDDLFGIV